MFTRRDWKTILWLTLASLVVRAGVHLLFAERLVAGSDSMQNILLGRKLASGDLYGVLDTYWAPVFPFLIGIFSLLYDSLTFPAVVVSIIFGTLAVPLTYVFVTQSYGERIGIVGALIALFYPYLINSVFAIGTENVYFVFILGALIAGWYGLVNSSVGTLFLTGVLVGLSYLTRPEAIGYVVFFAFWVLVKPRLAELEARPNRLRLLAVFLVGVFILAAPYIYYLRVETGHWTISDKTSRNLVQGTFSERAERPEIRSAGTLQKAKAFTWVFVIGVRDIQNSLANLLPLFLAAFAGLGLFARAWNRPRITREAFLISFCLLTAIGYAATVSLERYLYILLPIFFGWIACGIFELRRWHEETFGKFIKKYESLANGRLVIAGCLLFIFFYMFPVNFFVRSKVSEWQGAAYEERDAGIWLANNGGRDARIFSASFRPVFYTRGKQLWIDRDNSVEMFKYVRKERPDFVVDAERSYRESTELVRFGELLKQSPDFELVYEQNPRPGHRISVYRPRF